MTNSNSKSTFIQENNSNMQTNLVKASPTSEELQKWIVFYVAKLLDVPVQKVDVQMSFERYGLDSSAVISLIGDLETRLGCDLAPTLLFDYPNIQALSQYLAKEVSAK